MGKCSGNGVYHFHMSVRFEGDWADGKYDGFGVETFEVDWVDGKYDEFGVEMWAK